MKKILISLTVCLLSAYAFCQGNFTASYILDKSSVIYVGVPNPITIISNESRFNYTCTIDNGARLEKSSFGDYNVIVDTPGYYTLTIKSKKTSETSSYTLRAKEFSIPHANLQGNFGGEISKSDLVKIYQLSLNYGAGVDFDIRASVTKFSILRIARGGEQNEIYNEGGEFSKKTTEWINRCEKGDILIFRGIKGAGYLKPELFITDIVFYIN